MSPWASASPIRTLVTAACSCMTPPSSSGTPSMVTPSSAAWASSSGGVEQSASASSAAGRSFSSANARPASWNICCSSSGVRSKSPVDLLARLARRLAQLLGRLEGAAGGGRGAEAVLGRPVDDLLDLLADPHPVEQARAGKAVERLQPEAHAAVGDPLVGFDGAHLTLPSRCGVCFLASRTKKSVSLAVGAAAELDPAGQQDRAAEGDVDGEGVGQAGLERRQAARLGPHPVRDRRREAERLRGQRVHVDRVAVAGDGGVAAAEVAAQLPLGARRRGRRPGAAPESGVRSP